MNEANLAHAESLEPRSLDQAMEMWEHFSTDGGGPHYEILWRDLQELARSSAS